MKIAVEGCAHGELDKIYETIAHLEKENNVKIDLLIICGDFQAVRNRADLQCMAVPPKYQKLNTFYKYYSGEKTAPLLTLFVGGNHEASNYLSELPYGGWVCPNIYYMGYASVINVGGVRIAALSGIYKGQDFLKGHFEILPYSESSKRSVYHIRNLEVFRLKQISSPLDICISHDWPRGVYNYGDKEGLLRFKPFFKDDIDNEKLGSRPSEELLHKLAPSYWFAAHLHCRFAAMVPHDNDKKTYTRFLALDKCLPRRKFLQILDIGKEVSGETPTMEYDAEWLAILRSTKHLLNVNSSPNYMPGPGYSGRYDFTVTEDELKDIANVFSNDFTVPRNFLRTAAPHTSDQVCKASPELYQNPQTVTFCKILGIDDPIELLILSSPDKRVAKNASYVDDLDITNTSQLSLNPDGPSLTDGSMSDDDQGMSVAEGASTDLDSTSSSGFFYIDTRPTRNFTPPPRDGKLTLKERYAMHKSDTPLYTKFDMESSKQDFPELKEQAAGDDKEEETAEKLVIPFSGLKRRNQALYMNNDEEDND